MLGQDPLQLVKQFLPSRILVFLARKGIEMPRFDLVYQLNGFALSRDQIKPAPGHH